MDLRAEKAKRDQFTQILKDLALTENPSQYEKAQIFRQLEDLYHQPGDEDNFRHFYSDIFSVLIEIKAKDPHSGSLEYLLLNLDGLRQGYIPNKNLDSIGKPIDIQSYIRKLYDHVNLEIQRIRYSDYEDYKISKDQSIHYLEQKVTAAEAVIRTAQKRIDQTEKNNENAKKEYVAILGIFAAIVLAFTGGMVFSTSVLEHMHTVSIYRIVLISLVLGLVLFNTVYLLVWFINKIVRDEVGMNKWLFIVPNGIIFVAIAVVFYLWNIGFVENRNIDLIDSDVETSIVQMESTPNASQQNPEDPLLTE